MTAAEHINMAESFLGLTQLRDGDTDIQVVQTILADAQAHALIAIAMSLQSTMTPAATLTDVIESRS